MLFVMFVVLNLLLTALCIETLPASHPTQHAQHVLHNTFAPTKRFCTWERDPIVVHLNVKRRFLQGRMGGMGGPTGINSGELGNEYSTSVTL